jgi:hypothetical protein
MNFGAGACLLCCACEHVPPAAEDVEAGTRVEAPAPSDAFDAATAAPAATQPPATTPTPQSTPSASLQSSATTSPAGDAQSAPPRAAVPDAPKEVALPADWATSSRESFTADLDRWLPVGGRVRLGADSIVVLSSALWPADETSVRAAAILGRTLDPRAAAALLTRLEARVPERPDILFAGDVVAASAFTCGTITPDAAARLEALAHAPKPHPVLDVRVECAVASLILGHDGAIPFLLAILREGTPAQDPRPDWTRLDPDDERLLRLQDRAARALSDRVGIECAFRAHASVAARESETARLANLVSNLRPRSR